jgi:hypothetical protein
MIKNNAVPGVTERLEAETASSLDAGAWGGRSGKKQKYFEFSIAKIQAQHE